MDFRFFSKNLVRFGNNKSHLLLNSFFFVIDYLNYELLSSLPNLYKGSVEKITTHNSNRGNYDGKV